MTKNSHSAKNEQENYENYEFLAIRISNLLNGGNILIGDRLTFSTKIKPEKLNFSTEYLQNLNRILENYLENQPSNSEASNFNTEKIEFDLINVLNPSSDLKINGKEISNSL